MTHIDLRADTCARQSARMREAIAGLVPGDDVFGEDRSTVALEEYAAHLCGKSAALYFPSGTMANLVATLAHLRRGEEVILGKASHIFNYELGGAAVAGGIVYQTVDDSGGMLRAAEVEAAIRPADLYHASTGLVCIENTHNLEGGIASSPEQIEPIMEVVRRHKLPLHLDGARIFYACAALGVDVREYAAQVDSMMFCVTKGLGAPVGALLLGDKDFIDHARKLRKMLGGGMRQTGYLAAMALVALQDERRQLEQDVANARRLARGLQALPYLEVKSSARMTNMVYFKYSAGTINALDHVPRFAEQGIQLLATPEMFRFVCHNGVSEADLPRILDAVEKVFERAPGR